MILADQGFERTCVGLGRRIYWTEVDPGYFGFEHMEHEELTGAIIGCALRVHTALGPGFLESVYQNALTHELRKQGINVACECRIQVRYDDAVVGDFIADMLVNEVVLI